MRIVFVIFLLTAATLMCDYIVMHSGATYIGDITQETDELITIETVDGLVNAHRELIKKIIPAVSIVSRYKEKRAAASTADEHYQLSQWCFTNNYPIAGDRELAKALDLNPDIAKASEPKPDTHKRTEAERINRIIRLRRTISAVRNTYGSERVEKYIKVLDDYTAEEKAPIMIQQLNYTAPKYKPYREFLLKDLSTAPVQPKTLAAHLLKEPEVDLRTIITESLIKTPESKLVLEDTMLQALAAPSSSARARINSAETLGRIRSKRSVQVVMRRLKQIWGASARAHFFSSTEHTYVRDVTPVVAEMATSFDPEIDTYTTGMVLDVKIKSVERDMLIRSMQMITNNYIERTSDWLEWWENTGKSEYQ